MRYLYTPLASEELSVRGRYEMRASDGKLVAQEEWGRYRNPGSDVETMRSAKLEAMRSTPGRRASAVRWTRS